MIDKQDHNTELTEATETVNPIAIYQNNIYALIDDLKQDDQFIGLSDKELKQDRAFFPRLIQYIYNNYIGDILNNKIRKGYKIIYPHIDVLNDLFTIYIDIVNKYKWNNKPSLLEFAIFTGINRDTFYRWLNGDYSDLDKSINNTECIGNKDNDQGNEKVYRYITSNYRDSVRKWQEVCEQSLLDGNESVFNIFLLKSLHNYRDNNNDIQITVNHKQVISADDLPALIGVNDSNN